MGGQFPGEEVASMTKDMGWGKPLADPGIWLEAMEV